MKESHLKETTAKYGKEVIIDLHNCDMSKSNRVDLEKFIINLCDDILEMKREDLYFWDYSCEIEEYDKAPDHLKGISCVQFITTSNITIHTLDVLNKIFINVFSCKSFFAADVIDFAEQFFSGEAVNYREIDRL